MAYPKDKGKERPQDFPPFAFRTPPADATPGKVRAMMLTDSEAVALVAEPIARHILGDADLADAVLEAGLDWEHMIAVLPMDPAEQDPRDLAEIERLGVETVRLAQTIHARLASQQRGTAEQREAEKSPYKG